MNNTIYNPNIPKTNNQSGIVEILASLYFQMIGKITRLGIDKTSTFLNLDPNMDLRESFKEITSNLTRYKEILASPEGRQMISELVILLSDAINQLDKPINELTNKINELVTKEIDFGQRLLFNQVKIALGPVGSLISIVNDTLSATSKAAETASEVTGIFRNEVGKFNEIKEKIELWVEKLKTMSKIGEINLTTQPDFTSTVEPNPITSNSTVEPNYASMDIRGGKKKLSSLKHIQRGGKMAAKRTKKSINEFLNNGIKSSQIQKGLKGNISKTRRRVK
jgi:CRISPR/Cas system CSM-associated protein Csm2 small subunit